MGSPAAPTPAKVTGPANYQAPNPRYNSTLAAAQALAKKLVAQGYPNPLIVCNVLAVEPGQVAALNGVAEADFAANGIPTAPYVPMNLDYIFSGSDTGYQVLQNVGLIIWYEQLGYPFSMFLPK
jgi:hypothetical protein